jgi:hypothetical protein
VRSAVDFLLQILNVFIALQKMLENSTKNFETFPQVIHNVNYVTLYGACDFPHTTRRLKV